MTTRWIAVIAEDGGPIWRCSDFVEAGPQRAMPPPPGDLACRSISACSTKEPWEHGGAVAHRGWSIMLQGDSPVKVDICHLWGTETLSSDWGTAVAWCDIPSTSTIGVSARRITGSTARKQISQWSFFLHIWDIFSPTFFLSFSLNNYKFLKG